MAARASKTRSTNSDTDNDDFAKWHASIGGDDFRMFHLSRKARERYISERYITLNKVFYVLQIRGRLHLCTTLPGKNK